MSVFHSDLFRQQALIAGSWRDAADGTTLAVSNPSTGATLGQIPNMGRAEAQQAVDAAAAALPNWRALTAAQRAALLKKLAPPDPRKQNRAGADNDRRAGQAAGGSGRRNRLCRLVYRVVCRTRETRQRRDNPLPGADKRLMVIRQGGRRLRGDHPVELPGGDDHPEGRPGAGRGLYDGD